MDLLILHSHLMTVFMYACMPLHVCFLDQQTRDHLRNLVTLSGHIVVIVFL